MDADPNDRPDPDETDRVADPAPLDAEISDLGKVLPGGDDEEPHSPAEESDAQPPG